MYTSSKVMNHFGLNKMFAVPSTDTSWKEEYAYGWMLWRVAIWAYVITLALTLPSAVQKKKAQFRAESEVWLQQDEAEAYATVQRLLPQMAAGMVYYSNNGMVSHWEGDIERGAKMQAELVDAAGRCSKRLTKEEKDLIFKIGSEIFSQM